MLLPLLRADFQLVETYAYQAQPPLDVPITAFGGHADAQARERQQRRLRGSRALTNGDTGPGEIREYCKLDEACKSLMKAAMRQLHLSARGYHRVLKLARTIADLAGAELIGPAHLAEALQYRPRRLE
ncbi:MAG: hypothetical protein KatS3mg057_2275 [Herpetosiphonaceae bacterium]|nr:MAG: hypothetical protein KatS3mg057_2275 [Herpetosiphonaceae bacterium]